MTPQMIPAMGETDRRIFCLYVRHVLCYNK